jgi:hypothetical protein
MKLALQWALALVYWAVGWLLIGQITKETVLQGGWFIVFFLLSALVGILVKRSDDSSAFEEVEPSIKTDCISQGKTLNEQISNHDVPARAMDHLKIEYPYRSFTPNDSQSNASIPKSIKFSLPSDEQLEKQEIHNGTVLSQASESLEVPNPQKAARQKLIRKTANVFDPAHYSRHTGIPGFLYIARNDCHQLGLYKIGYTTLPASQRIEGLNKQHALAFDVGRFTLVYAVQVGGSYDAEQALFDAIAETRVAAKREYFFERSDFLIKALQAASTFNSGNPDALNDFLDWALDQESWEKFRPPICESVTVVPKLKSTDGWIYVARNQWHRDSIIRIGHSKNDPQIKVNELNRKQRELTCQIGFYKLVKCVVVEDMKAVFTRLVSLLKQYKVPGSRVFFDVPLSKWTEALIEATQSGEKILPASIPIEVNKEIWVDIVPMTAHPTWAAWTARCSTCHQLLRFRGAICTAGTVDCPNCGTHIRCRIESNGVNVSIP